MWSWVPGSACGPRWVLRGDYHFIKVGASSNIQDGAVVHNDTEHPRFVIGADCVIGHRFGRGPRGVSRRPLPDWHPCGDPQ